jgi:hypothetical protein
MNKGEKIGNLFVDEAVVGSKACDIIVVSDGSTPSLDL